MRAFLVILLSGVVLLSAPAAMALAAWLVVLGWPSNFFAFLGAGLCLVLAYCLRPRPYRIPRSERSRDWEHPRLHGFIADVSTAVGTAPPAVVGVNGDFEVQAVRAGLFQRRALVLGYPLLALASPQACVAGAAREMAHLRARRALRYSMASLAIDTLDRWIQFLSPEYALGPATDNSGEADAANLVDFISRPVGWVLALLPRGLRKLLQGLASSDQESSEVDAERLAVAVGGIDAVTELILLSTCHDLLEDAVHRVATKRTEVSVFGEARRQIEEHRAERTRQLMEEEEMQSRVRAIREHVVASARHRLSEQEADSILRELDEPARRIERDLIHAYLYEWQQY